MFFHGGGVFSIVSIIVVVLIACSILFRIGVGIVHRQSGNRQPTLTVSATVVSKRMQVQRHTSNTNGQITSSHTVSYFVTFQVRDGDKIELKVRGQDYARLSEQDVGHLMFQGPRFISFKPR